MNTARLESPAQPRLLDLADETQSMLECIGDALVRAFVPSRWWRERRHARRTSRELLRLYASVATHQPQLDRRERYCRVVMRHTGTGPEEAEALLKRAEDSYATWPEGRGLAFADIVHWLVVTEILHATGEASTRDDIARVIAARIPADL